MCDRRGSRPCGRSSRLQVRVQKSSEQELAKNEGIVIEMHMLKDEYFYADDEGAIPIQEPEYFIMSRNHYSLFVDRIDAGGYVAPLAGR